MTPIDTPIKAARASQDHVDRGRCGGVGAWRKSRKSADGTGQCVEAGLCSCCGVAIRDTKLHAAGTLVVSMAEWTTILTAIKDR